VNPPGPGDTGGGVPLPDITPGTPVNVIDASVGNVPSGLGTGIHWGTSQHVGSFGSGTNVQPVGSVG